MAEIDIDLVDLQEDYMVKYMRSVLEDRAIPDLRDGLKPGQRYCVWDIFNSGYLPNKPHTKCAMIVGSVIGKYHPHGDASTYQALTRLSQDFVNNIPVIDFHGCNGTINGDPPAAYRYTECRLSKFALENLCDNINKNAVDFVPNYLNILQEPTVLPSKVCNLLVNGSLGIASGFVSSIPPHNIKDVCEMTIKCIKNPKISLDEIAKNFRPDFPTGGIICNNSEITNAYKTGKGVIKIRANAEIIEKKKGYPIIHITSIPYLTTVGPRISPTSQNADGGIINSIVDKIKDGTIEGILDIQDHSKKDIDINIFIKKDYDPNVILNKLYKCTKLQASYKVQLVCLNNKRYSYYNIKDILMEFIKFRKETISRTIVFDLNKIKRRIHILEGLILSFDYIDKIIEIIKKSSDKDSMKQKIKKLVPKLTDVQVTSIIEMKLYELSKVDRNKIVEERKDKLAQVDTLIENLKPDNINKIIIEEQKECMKKYETERKTVLTDMNTNIDEEDIIAEEDCVVVLTKDGYAKRIPTDKFKTQNRNTQGNNLSGDKSVRDMFTTNTKEHLLCFTNTGRVFDVKVYKIPEGNVKNKGSRLPINLKSDEKVVKFLCLSDEQFTDSNSYLIFITKNGFGKKTLLSEFANINSAGIKAITLKNADISGRIAFVGFIDGNKEMQDILITTANGMTVRYNHEQFQPMGRAASGVTAIKLVGDDLIVGACIIENIDDKIFFITKDGLGKTTLVEDKVVKKDPNTKKMVEINDGFPRLKRSYNIKGRIGISLNKNDKVVECLVIHDKETPDLIITTKHKVLTISTKDFLEPSKRPTKGKKLISITDEEDYIRSVTLKN